MAILYDTCQFFVLIAHLIRRKPTARFYPNTRANHPLRRAFPSSVSAAWLATASTLANAHSFKHGSRATWVASSSNTPVSQSNAATPNPSAETIATSRHASTSGTSAAAVRPRLSACLTRHDPRGPSRIQPPCSEPCSRKRASLPRHKARVASASTSDTGAPWSTSSTIGFCPARTSKTRTEPSSAPTATRLCALSSSALVEIAVGDADNRPRSVEATELELEEEQVFFPRPKSTKRVDQSCTPYATRVSSKEATHVVKSLCHGASSLGTVSNLLEVSDTNTDPGSGFKLSTRQR
mmetsp:Transcript_12090/g.50616  ORF Transcript_12090/g.50616 Transcript_12090/m.50616 type:complete len:295 (+) Transcript_12090:80-964(+)